MLDVSPSREVVRRRWEQLQVRVTLPCSPDEYFSQRGPLVVHPDSRRRFHRFHFRCVAIIHYQDVEYAGYAKDISRMGMGLYAPVQLFPCDSVVLHVPDRDPIEAEVTRCRRLGEACYEFGTVFCRVEVDSNTKVEA